MRALLQRSIEYPLSRRTFVASIGSAAAVAACGHLATASDRRQLVIATATEPNSFDPQFAYFGPNRQAHMPVFEPLAMYGPKLELQPALATQWRSVGPKSWEVELRRGVRFHDGSEFSAEDVVFSLARAPTVPNSPSSMGVYTQSIAAVRVKSAHSLLIETKTTAPLLMFDLANIPILCKEASGRSTTASFDAGQAIVGTGPFRFVRWNRGASIEYASFEDYWGGRSPWRGVEVDYRLAGEDRVEMLLSGKAQLMDQVPPASIARLRAAPGIKLSQIPSNFLLYLHLDQARVHSPFITDKAGQQIRNPLLDVRVRKAMSLAVNRRAITEEILSGSAVPASQLLPSSFAGTLADLPDIPFDPRAARELLAAAGYSSGFRMTLHGTRGRYANDVEVLEAIARNLREIGIDAHAISLPSNEFFARASGTAGGEPEFSAIQVGWASVEPSGALKGILATADKQSGSGSSNRGRYSNKKVDETLRQALEEVDPSARAELLRTATRIAIVTDQAIIPLYFPTNTWASVSTVSYEPRVDSSTFAANAAPI